MSVGKERERKGREREGKERRRRGEAKRRGIEMDVEKKLIRYTLRTKNMKLKLFSSFRGFTV